MAKRSTRTGREGRRKLNESQLQAYRARKAATVVETPSEPVAARSESRAAERSERSYRRVVQTGHVTAWGHVGEEYEMIRADLKRLFLITILMFIIIVILWFILA